jgi:hypothetical protein
VGHKVDQKRSANLRTSIFPNVRLSIRTSNSSDLAARASNIASISSTPYEVSKDKHPLGKGVWLPDQYR